MENKIVTVTKEYDKDGNIIRETTTTSPYDNKDTCSFAKYTDHVDLDDVVIINGGVYAYLDDDDDLFDDDFDDDDFFVDDDDDECDDCDCCKHESDYSEWLYDIQFRMDKMIKMMKDLSMEIETIGDEID